MADNGVEIALVVEKADDTPIFSNTNISVFTLVHKTPLRRYYELFKVIRGLIRSGFNHTYVRIAAPATLIATLAHRLYGGQTFLWQSGTTHEYDAAQPLSWKKMRWYFSSHIPNAMARRYVSTFVTGPQYMVDYYSNVVGIDPDKIRLLYNDIDLERFSPRSDKIAQRIQFLQQHGLAKDTLLLLLVHRLSPVRLTGRYFPYCITHLRDAGLLDDVCIVIAGDGEELTSLKAEAEASGVSNHCLFLGGVPNREIQNLYGISDIFVHPTYNEGFPRVVIEAMASALPIVSTDAGGTLELVGPNQAKLIVDKNSPSDFSKTLAGLIEDEQLQHKLAKENLSHVRRFSTENIALMYEEVLFE